MRDGFSESLSFERAAAWWGEAQAAERRGELDTAAAMYQVLLDLDDRARELGDIRASAGIALALLRLEQSQATAAAAALRRVAALPAAPPELAAVARRALGELRH